MADSCFPCAARSLPSVQGKRSAAVFSVWWHMTVWGWCLAACATAFAWLPMTASAASSAPAATAVAPATPLNVVAAENFYGDLVQRLGGAQVSVNSILSNPNQDPHAFEVSPQVARSLSRADLVIYNGADYDPWMQKLLSASPRGGRTEIVAAQVAGKKSGDNPHLWYDPATMPAVARAVTAYLTQRDPAHRADYDARLAQFQAALQPVEQKVAAMRGKYHGVAVSATEPVFGYMAAALGLKMLNERFQLAVMNESEPSAIDVARFESGLKSKEIKALLYNAQVSDQMSRRLLAIARTAGVPVVPVTETQPAGQRFEQWMLHQLTLLDQALSSAAG